MSQKPREGPPNVRVPRAFWAARVKNASSRQHSHQQGQGLQRQVPEGTGRGRDRSPKAGGVKCVRQGARHHRSLGRRHPHPAAQLKRRRTPRVWAGTAVTLSSDPAGDSEDAGFGRGRQLPKPRKLLRTAACQPAEPPGQAPHGRERGVPTETRTQPRKRANPGPAAPLSRPQDRRCPRDKNARVTGLHRQVACKKPEPLPPGKSGDV